MFRAQNAEAMVGLAYARVGSTNYGWSTATEDSYVAQLELVTKATAPVGGLWHTILGVSEACLGRLDAAIAEYKRGIDAGCRTYFPYAYLAGAEAAKGNDAEAKSALAEARRLNPQLTIKSFAETLPREPIVIDGLRNAGLPEE